MSATHGIYVRDGSGIIYVDVDMTIFHSAAEWFQSKKQKKQQVLLREPVLVPVECNVKQSTYSAIIDINLGLFQFPRSLQYETVVS